MIADLKPYPEYKQTEIEWLGGLPSHWQELSLKRIARSENSGCYGSEPESGIKVLPVATTAQIDRDGGFSVSRMPQRGFTEEDVVRYCCRTGDILVVKSSGSAANVISGKAGIVRADTPPFVFSNFLMRYIARPPQVEPEFLFLLLTCNLTRERVKRMVSTTTYPNLRVGEYTSALLPVPPRVEQAAIVRFLDWANGRLERAIRAKRKVIALFNEQKHATIHRAVTRGLDPFVPLKSSGIPWLGEIPQHWEVRRLKSLCRFVTSGSRGWARYYANAGFVFLRIGNISTTSVDLRLKHVTYVTPPAGAEGERTRAIPNDLLLSITAQIGAVGVVPDGLGDAFVNQHTALIRLRPQQSVPRWVAYVLLSQFGKDQCQLMTNGGTKVGLTLNDVRCLSVLLPPLEEQLRLVVGIENQTRELDRAVSRLEREIDLLREYRTRLVADVVTGKLDVREAAARLPDEAPPEIVEDDGDPSSDLDVEDEEAVA